jgi:hypothetical protein
MKTSSTKTSKVAVADLTKLLKPYRSGWVALSKDQRRVVGAAETLQGTHDQALERGVPNAVFVKVIPPDQGYLPFSL